MIAIIKALREGLSRRLPALLFLEALLRNLSIALIIALVPGPSALIGALLMHRSMCAASRKNYNNKTCQQC